MNELIICSGPVIIKDGKVLLIKEKKGNEITPWFFPGGKVEKTDESLEETCKREAREEVGLNIKIIKQLPTLDDKDKDGNKIKLVHYLCSASGTIKPGPTIVEWNWFDINNLPDNCANNVCEIVSNLNNTNAYGH